jgi:hypothetical protein
MTITVNSAHLVAQGGTTGAGGDKTARLWILAATENAAAIETAGALNAFAGHMQRGDMIMASMVRGGTPVGKCYIVTAADATSITIAPFVDNT